MDSIHRREAAGDENGQSRDHAGFALLSLCFIARAHRIAFAGSFARVGCALGLLLVLSTPSIAIRAEGPPRIVAIRIVAQDVFPDEAARSNSVFRIASRIHIGTRESLIRRFLLFREGDALDAEVLAQTERNLRALEFLGSASIRVIPLDDASVEVELLTRDAWTTDPGISLGSTGGAGRLGFELTEKNLFGGGRALTILLDENSEANRGILRALRRSG